VRLAREGHGDLMTFHFQNHGVPATGAVAMYDLLTKLLAVGWTNKSDSDGTTYAFAGGQVTGGGSGAHGLGNAFAWVRFREPVASGGTREYTAQRGATNKHWRFKASASSKFGLGAPSATQTPSAADEVVILGGGTDAAPVFTLLFDGDGTFALHTIADDSTFDAFAFAMFTYLVGGTGETSTMWWSDPVGYGVEIIQGPSVPHLLGTLSASMVNVGGVTPAVTWIFPTPGDVVHRQDPLHFQVTTQSGGSFASLAVGVEFPSGIWELVHDGTSFSAQYSVGSTRNAISNGYDFVVQRTGGWPQDPTLKIIGADSSGNAVP
jgi:hypothetical protein